jgi:hypothetical protein
MLAPKGRSSTSDEVEEFVEFELESFDEFESPGELEAGPEAKTAYEVFGHSSAKRIMVEEVQPPSQALSEQRKSLHVGCDN